MTEPKKILYLITKSNWGGAQRYVYDLATNLDKAEFEPVIALGGDGVLRELLTHAGIRTISITSLERDISLKKEWLFAKELWSILQKEKPDVLHVNSSKAGGIGTLLGRLAVTPRVVFTAHGWAFNEDRPWWQRIVIKTLHWLTVLFSHKTITVSRGVRHQMNWWGVRKKMKVIHPGRTLGVTYSRREAREKIAGFLPSLSAFVSDPWLLTIAELHPIKRLSVLITALATLRTDLPNLRLVIIGEGGERQRLEREIAQKNLSQHVFLTGSITEAARFLKAGDLFVLPSKSESYGYVLHEAGLAEVPVISTNVGGIPDIVIHGQSGWLVSPDDAPALVSAIHDWHATPATWENYAKHLKYSMQHRSVETMVTATTELYRNLLK